METEKITYSYLEALSFTQLTEIADEYGLDVPESFNRRFLIEEILELVTESDKLNGESMVIASELANRGTKQLANNYNETQISCVLCNPVWAFVFWNISDHDRAELKKLSMPELMIRVCILSSKEELKPEQVFEVKASLDSQEQYILLPSTSKFFRFELIYVDASFGKVLAFSPVIEIPQPAKYVNEFRPGIENTFSEILKLSRIDDVLLEQYKKHRHSFS